MARKLTLDERVERGMRKEPQDRTHADKTAWREMVTGVLAEYDKMVADADEMLTRMTEERDA